VGSHSINRNPKKIQSRLVGAVTGLFDLLNEGLTEFLGAGIKIVLKLRFAQDIVHCKETLWVSEYCLFFLWLNYIWIKNVKDIAISTFSLLSLAGNEFLVLLDILLTFR
jgi:hypothetical protein